MQLWIEDSVRHQRLKDKENGEEGEKEISERKCIESENDHLNSLRYYIIHVYIETLEACGSSKIATDTLT